jgi:hypothetical protein
MSLHFLDFLGLTVYHPTWRNVPETQELRPTSMCYSSVVVLFEANTLLTASLNNRKNRPRHLLCISVLLHPLYKLGFFKDVQ